MATPTENEQALQARVERLEQLLMLMSGGGIGPAASFAGPIVATEAAASALRGLVDGEQVFVLSHRSIWTKRVGTAGVQGTPPLAAHEVITSLDSLGVVNGVLMRTNYSDPALRIGINSIFIDPANGAANDENNGLTAGAPLQTGMELFRRWGWGNQVLVGPNLATSADDFLHINVQSNLVSPDSLPMNVIVARDANGIWIESPLLAANVLRTAVLTDAVTAMNRAVPAPGGTRLTIRDNTLANWSAFMVANRRVRFTDGPASGGTLQVQTDNVATPGQVQCSPCQTTNAAGFSQTPTTVTPAVGNTYVVESLVQVNLGMPFKVEQQLNPAIGGFNIFVNLVNINLPTTQFSQPWAPIMGAGTWQGPNLNLYQCTIDRVIDWSMAATWVPIACLFTEGFDCIGSSNGVVAGGGINRVASTQQPQIFYGSTSFFDGLNNDFVANLTTIFLVGNTTVGNFATWNVVAGAVAGNTGGHGAIVGRNAALVGMRAAVNFKGTHWGQGNAGVGLLVGANCNGAGAPQNSTGTAGDFKLANKLVGWWWNDATGVYNPVGAGIATTWANLTAAEGAAGFGGNAHELDSNSHFVAVETTA